MDLIQSFLLKSFDKYKDRPYLYYKNEWISYQRLKEEVLSMSIYIESQIKEAECICVYSQDDFFIICALLACLLCRKIFFYLDPRDPENYRKTLLERIRKTYILRDFPPKNKDLSFCPSFYEMDDSIYLYATSGTTGEPKLVIGKNAPLSNFLLWQKKAYGFNSKDCFLRLHPYSHDPSLRDILSPLLCGGRIVALDSPFDLLDREKIQRAIFDHRINRIHLTPSIFKILLGKDKPLYSLASIKDLFLSGEEISLGDCRRFKNLYPQADISNFYWPTEATLIQFAHRITEEDFLKAAIPIGGPIEGIFYQILSIQGEECLFIGSKHGVLEYYDQKDGKDFVQLKDGKRYFNTGDIVREKEGNLYYLGRKDQQYKIRGHRISLQEMEKIVLKGFPGASFHLQVYKDKGQNRVALFFIGEKSIKEETFRREFAKEAPHYMHINKVCYLDKLPLTKNGKVNRKALEKRYLLGEPSLVGIKGKEDLLAKIWKDLLHLEFIEEDSHFFLSGCDSLDVFRLILELEEFSYKLTAKDIFEEPCFAAMVKNMEKFQTIAHQVTKVDFLPLQKQILKVEKIINSSRFWKMDFELEFSPPYSKEDIVISCKQLIEQVGSFWIYPNEDLDLCLASKACVNLGEKTGSQVALNPWGQFMGSIKIEEKAEKILCSCSFHHLTFDQKSMDLLGEKIVAISRGAVHERDKSYRDFLRIRHRELHMDNSYWQKKNWKDHSFKPVFKEDKNSFKEKIFLPRKKTKNYTDYTLFIAALSLALAKNMGREKIGFHSFLDL